MVRDSSMVGPMKLHPETLGLVPLFSSLTYVQRVLSLQWGGWLAPP